LLPSGEKLATEAPVNGGRNYDGPKVNYEFCSNSHALEKSGYMLETLSIRRYSPGQPGSDNPSVQAISRKGHVPEDVESSEAIRQTIRSKRWSELHGDMQRPAEMTGPRNKLMLVAK